MVTGEKQSAPALRRLPPHRPGVVAKSSRYGKTSSGFRPHHVDSLPDSGGPQRVFAGYSGPSAADLHRFPFLAVFVYQDVLI
jgi:hypothetical protein